VRSSTVETREAYLAALDELFCPALIVSDYRLPHFDGMNALKLAVERCPDVPFIILTGSMNEDTAVRVHEGRGWDYVIKEHVQTTGPAVESALSGAAANGLGASGPRSIFGAAREESATCSRTPSWESHRLSRDTPDRQKPIQRSRMYGYSTLWR